jgi:CubicO group peptidase (beta-lactamase class C family)
MIKVMQAAVLVLVLAACASPPPAAEAGAAPNVCALGEAPDAALARAIDPILDAAAVDGFAGQVAIMHGGVFVYRRAAGFADNGDAVPVTHDTRFHTASVGKYFTAALTLVAVEEGRLSLDQRVAPLFPGIRTVPAGVTISDLLAHRSGLGSSYVTEQQTEALDAAAAIGAVPYDPSRAGSFHYSNDGYDLLGIILETAYGQPYETLLREKLLNRACLNQVAFWGETDLTDARLVGQPPSGFPEALRHRNYGMLASSGILISATDLARWQHALRSGGLLSPASVEQLYAPRGPLSIGQAAYGSFLIAHPQLGDVISARGAEDWGDNTCLNDYIDCGFTLAIETSRGPAEDSGKPRYRDSLSQAIEPVLAERCAR